MRGLDFSFSSRSAEDTRQAGIQFAAHLKPGMIVALEGDLGSGKTEFVRGACKALGVDEEIVTSPTFVIVNEYPGLETTVFHIDAYRLESEAEFYDLGYEDYFSSDAISFVEWPERLPTVMSGPEVIHLRFEHLGGNNRRIDLRPSDI